MYTEANSKFLKQEQQWRERREVRRDAQFVGFLLLALFAAQILTMVVLIVLSLFGVPDLSQKYYGFGDVGYQFFQMLTYVLYLAVPVLFVAVVSRRWDNPFASKKPPRGVFLTAIFGGMVLSAFANVATGALMKLLTNVGVPEPNLPETIEVSVLSLVLNGISTALFPAILEEMVFRGYVLRALQPHGNTVAVVISAVLFGLIHGNVLQVPFALILGLMLGWLTVQADNIWPAVVLHGVNNLFSVVMRWLELRLPDNPMISAAPLIVLCVAGVIVLVVLFSNRTAYHKDLLRPMGNGVSALRVRQRVWAIVTAPAFLVGGCLWLLMLLLSMLPK